VCDLVRVPEEVRLDLARGGHALEHLRVRAARREARQACVSEPGDILDIAPAYVAHDDADSKITQPFQASKVLYRSCISQFVRVLLVKCVALAVSCDAIEIWGRARRWRG
jgi:hypothetical protein